MISKLKSEMKIEVTLFQAVSSLTYYVVAGEASARVPYTEKELEVIKHKSIDYLKKTRDTLKSYGAIVKTKVSTGNAASEIVKTANEINADVIAMSTHGRSGLGRWAFGSVTDRVLHEASVPILMIRAPKEERET
jgi:nucleotide-binding universal stress UspA family protein